MTDEDEASLLARAVVGCFQDPEHPLAPFFMAPWHDPLAAGIIKACTICAMRVPGLGTRILDEIIQAGTGSNADDRFDTLLQKLAEVYVLAWLLAIDWPEGTTFAHEPRSPVSGKRPELLIGTPEGRYGFEVKAPALTGFRVKRHQNPVQLVGRTSKDRIGDVFPDADTTLPRDNPMKDFLASADEKFQGFNTTEGDRSFLIVVWDGLLHEPISALIHPIAGLLTPQSFARDSNNQARVYPSLDGVMLVSRLGIFINAFEAGPHPAGWNVMDPRRHDALPTAYIQTDGGKPLPEFLREPLRIVPAGDPRLPLADLQPLDMVVWMDRIRPRRPPK